MSLNVVLNDKNPSFSIPESTMWQTDWKNNLKLHKIIPLPKS